jgi:murein DD-endopeptidase MepM/ murein hydrolase activator NlpD
MKKKKLLISFIIFSFLLSYTIIPISVEAKTINEYQAEVDKYVADLEAKKAKIVTNQQEVAKIKTKINDIESQITQAENDINTLQAEIDKSNEEIKEKTNETKKIMEYYQISNGDNAYLEYAMGAEDITDMVYRMSIIEQLTEYNDKIMKELQKLIDDNKQKQADLTKKQQDLKSLQSELESEKEKIEADTASIEAGMPSLEQQIKAAKSSIATLKAMGCGANEEISTCERRSSGSIPSTNGFYRPIEYGSVSQWYGGNYPNHMGIDMISSNRAIEIYPIASGKIVAKFYDSAGALVVKIRHNVNGRTIYSTYAHMRSFGPISVGQTVTENTLLGYMGSTGNSTGPHLHLEITSCDWNVDCTWKTYMYSTINPRNYIDIPSEWTNR